MRRRLNLWAVVITAALTFGSLMAFVGPRSFGHHRGHWPYGHRYYDGYGHDRAWNNDGPPARNWKPNADSTEIR